MLPILQVGPLTLRTPGLALLAGLWFGLEAASRAGMRRGIPEDKMYNIGFYAVIAGVLGARLAFVLTHLNLYTRITPWPRALGSVFALAPGTEVGWAGLLIAAALVAYLIWRWELDPLAVGDAFAPGIAIMALGVGLATFLSGEMYGIPTQLPWGIPLWGATRHPTQIYFMLAAAGALVLIWRIRPQQSGALLQITLLVLCVALLLIEPLRADSPTIGPGLRVWQIVALVVIIASLAGFAIRPPQVTADAANA